MYVENRASRGNKPFPSWLFHLFQNESWSTIFHIEMSLTFKAITYKKNSFPYEWLCTKTCVETKGKENSEMAY